MDRLNEDQVETPAAAVDTQKEAVIAELLQGYQASNRLPLEYVLARRDALKAAGRSSEPFMNGIVHG